MSTMIYDEPRTFGVYRSRATYLLGSQKALAALIELSSRFAASPRARLQALAGLRDNLSTCVALVKAWYAGEYREVAASSVVMIAAALLYFVTPTDAIPDFIAGFGLIDDAAVIGYVVTQLKVELAAFRAWQAAFDVDATAR